MVFNAIQAVLMILIIMAVGYFISYKGWVTKGVTSFISRLIINITMPCTALMALMNNFSVELAADSWRYIAAAFLSIGIAYGLAKLVIKIAKIEKTQRGVFTMLFAYSNSMFIGFPVAAAIFGDQALVYALFYYIANTTFANSLGYMETARDGMEIKRLATGAQAEAVKIPARQLIKKLFQPPMIAVIIGFVLVVLNIRLPDFLSSALNYIGNVTSPLALLFVGMILQQIGLSCLKQVDKKLTLAVVGRFLVSPLVMAAVAALLVMPQLPSEVFIVQAGLPVMTSVTIFAERCGADVGFAAKGILATSLLAFLAIPMYILLF